MWRKIRTTTNLSNARLQLDASFIVSGDKDLAGTNNYMGILIVTPKKFFRDHP